MPWIDLVVLAGHGDRLQIVRKFCGVKVKLDGGDRSPRPYWSEARGSTTLFAGRGTQNHRECRLAAGLSRCQPLRRADFDSGVDADERDIGRIVLNSQRPNGGRDGKRREGAAHLLGRGP